MGFVQQRGFWAGTGRATHLSRNIVQVFEGQSIPEIRILSPHLTQTPRVFGQGAGAENFEDTTADLGGRPPLPKWREFQGGDQTQQNTSSRRCPPRVCSIPPEPPASLEIARLICSGRSLRLLENCGLGFRVWGLGFRV